MMAEPGMDRIKAGLNDVRLHNATATILLQLPFSW